MQKATLVIMAAGLGSRYGGGIKQLDRVGPSGEIIMDYSIYDAAMAGFDKVVFIIRRDLEEDFKEIIGNRISKKIKTEYVFQELDCIPDEFHVPDGRTKPWGTGHAVLCCKDVVKEPFLVINADDYYGKEAFVKAYNYLTESTAMPKQLNEGIYERKEYCMPGFVLGNTLSENGAVTRGVCKVDEKGMLKGIEETYGIVKQGETACGKDKDGREIIMSLDTPVSMNMWGFMPDFFDTLERGFVEFLKKLIVGDELKSEYLLPVVAGSVIKDTGIRVLRISDKWFGVTYKEDRQAVADSLQKLVDEGKYPKSIV